MVWAADYRRRRGTLLEDRGPATYPTAGWLRLVYVWPMEGVALIRARTVLAGRYQLEQRIASGGMGEVWRAFDEVLGRTVAVKRLLAALPDEPSFIDRFQAEARTMATISHPNVVEVYDFGDDPVAGVYLVMKYIDGESLARTLARVGRLSVEATMRLVAEAAEALHAAHDKGVTHRDVKPGNLLLRPDGGAMLTDFGIARFAEATGYSTTGTLSGTSGYIAPERLNGQPATARSDIYSLGVVAYRCLAGRMPFDGESPLEVALRHVHDELPPLPADVPPGVRAVVERAMAKDPADRWPSGAVLAAQARRALAPAQPFQDHSTVPVPMAAGERTVTGGRGARRLLVPAAALVVVAIITTVSLILGRGGGSQPQSLRGNPGAGATGSAGSVGATEPAPSQGATSPGPSSGATGPAIDPGATRPRPGTGITPPAAPKNLTATPIDPHTIRLQWSDGSANEDGFTINNALTSRNVRTGTTTYDWDGMPAAYYSCFKVRAYNSSGESEYYPAAAMDWVCATTLSGEGPTAPSGLIAEAVNAGTIRLQWTDNSDDEEGFTINNAKTSRNVGADTTTSEWSVSPGTYMCFIVRSYKWAGVSAYSDWACVTTPTT